MESIGISYDNHGWNSSGGRVTWDLLGSICVERRPVITQDLHEIELRFKKYMEEAGVENSHYSDHELRHIEDL
ncbi:DBR1 [Cordylochernes scorpioides]|uniref:DBR1 n=1 Tax=Cordylochernes scorpioides TaxID=51811 RepID=A0ABY6K436_9ARAC|nr:DBR1 [Cordylochernes scorpioides]